MIDEERFPGRQGRLLFAYLVAEQGRPVPRDELADALWGEAPPATSDKALTVLASKLRALLGELGVDGTKALASAFGSYRLNLPEGTWVDIIAAADALRDAEAALAADDLDQAKSVAMQAASLARPSFLPGEEGAWIDGKRRELMDILRRALSSLAEASLRSGHAAEAAKWAEETIALDPYRETGYRQLMAAHAAAGNRAEALRVYERCRQLLATELGAYPSPETESIYRELLEAPSEPRAAASKTAPVALLERERPSSEEPASSAAPWYRQRRKIAIGALAGVIAAAVAIPLFALGGGASRAELGETRGNLVSEEENAVVEIDPASNEVVGKVSNVGARPASIAYGSGSLWVANLDDQSVTRIDPATHTVAKTLPVVDTPTGLATSPGAVWVVGASPTRPSVTVRRIDPQFDTVTQKRRIGNVVPGGPGSVATRGNAVWVAPSSGLLSRLSPQSAQVLQRIDPNGGQTAVAVGPDAVWISDASEQASTVTRVDPTGALTPIAVGRGPSGIAVGGGAVWVAASLEDAVVRIDPSTRRATTTIPVGSSPVGVAVGYGSVWVANSRDGTVSRIDAANPDVVETIEVGGSPQGVTLANGHVWVTVQPSARDRKAPSPGGTVRIVHERDVDSMDPALSYSVDSWVLLYASCAKLLNYPDKPAPEGLRLEPEVAQSLPKRSADGRTYTFTIREGFRFSPPSNERVTAETFKDTIERSLSPRIKGAAHELGYLADIVGAQAYMKGKAQHISGIVARGNTLTVRLVAPAPDFVSRIAMPFFCAVPIGTPHEPKGVRLVPAAGPYYVASYAPGQGVVLKRNPNYGGSRPRRPERIEFSPGISNEKAIRQVEAGNADYAMGGMAPAMAPRLATRYGPGSEAAKKGRQQYFLNTGPSLGFIVLNTHRPLFRDVNLRKAVNYALDRRAIARLGSPFQPLPDRPTDQYLPPGIPGFADVRIYPLTPDVAAARRLAGRKQRKAVLYTCNVTPCDQQAQIIRSGLAAIGIDLEVKAFPNNEVFQRLGRDGEPFDLAVIGWIPDYPDPAFLNFLLLTGIIPTLDDPEYKRKLEAAARLSGPPRYLAYGRLDADLARNAAPWVALVNGVGRDFFSARIGCQVFQPVYAGMDLAALCIRP